MRTALWISTLSSALLLVTSAQAADLVIGPIEPPSPEVYDWTGAYIGAHAGYLAGIVDVDYEGIPGGGDIDGLLAGLYAGYNWQSAGIVFGMEGDVGLGDVGGDGFTSPPPPSPATDYTYRLNWNAHLRGRIGLPAGNALFYLAGGLAVASHTLGIDYGPPLMTVGEDTQVHVGWTLGVGAELAPTDNMVLRIEYLYDDYGSRVYTDQQIPSCISSLRLTGSVSVSSCRSNALMFSARTNS